MREFAFDGDQLFVYVHDVLEVDVCEGAPDLRHASEQ
jgi:hypothetical protein